VAPLRSVAAVGEGGPRDLRFRMCPASLPSSDPDHGYRKVGMEGESDASEVMVRKEKVEFVEAMEAGRCLGVPRIGCDICGTGRRGKISVLGADEEEEDVCASKVIPDMSVDSL
jgi:hypothetical protein